MSCEEEEEMTEWRVMKRTEDGEVGLEKHTVLDLYVYFCQHVVVKYSGPFLM